MELDRKPFMICGLVFYLGVSRLVATIVYLTTMIREDVTLRKMSLNDLKYYVFLNHGPVKSARCKHFIFLTKVNWLVGLNI